MAIPIKTEEQIQKMRASGKIVHEVLGLIEAAIKPGVTTRELDKIAEDHIRKNGATGSFKGYHGFPSTICASVNSQVVHGIPGKQKLVSGDIISVDVGAYLDGFHGDAARTFAVGEVSEEAKQLIEVTKECFFEGIKFAKVGCSLHQISNAINEHANKYGYGVVRDFVGHGIGRALHEEPQIPHYTQKSRGPKLVKGMVIAIEPMINLGTAEVVVLEDEWTAVTADGKISAHYENTVLITDGEPELLTLPNNTVL